MPRTPPDPRFGPDAIRALRAGRSRAAFADLLGVTPLTVYRWELPDDSNQARRPRGAMLERLCALAERGCRECVVDDISNSAVAAAQSLRLSPDEERLVLPSVDRILCCDWRRSESELLSVLISKQLVSVDARAFASVGLAQIQLLLRSDAQSAIATLLPALADADGGLLSRPIEAQTHAIAALVFAWTDGRIFDLPRSNLHAQRAEELSGTGDIDVRFMARLAGVMAGLGMTDQALLLRATARLGEYDQAALPPLLACFAAEARGLEAWFRGNRGTSRTWFRQTAERAESGGYPCLLARALSFVAMRDLDDLADPAAALELTRRSQAVARAARLGVGLHTMFAATCAAEALLRLARFDEARRVLEEATGTLEDAELPALALVNTQLRLFVLTGQLGSISQLATHLEAQARTAVGRSRAVPGASSLAAYAAYARALSELFSQPDRSLMIAAFQDAESTAADWVMVLRDVLVAVVPALILCARLSDARLAVRRAHRFLDRFPSPSRATLLRHWEGMLSAWLGRWNEARSSLEAAAGTFELAGDLPQAALTRRSLALLGHLANEPDAPARLAASSAELERLGVAATAWPRFEEARMLRPAEDIAPDSSPGKSPPSIVAHVQRLSVRGVGPAFLHRELLAVLAAVFPGRGIVLDEVGSAGAVESLGSVDASRPDRIEWFEFGDGVGRRLRVGVEGPLDDASVASATTLVHVASLALEVAALRGLGDAPDAVTHSEALVELPGFIAASPAMRRLRTELQRLSGSRATSIITGESGVGKEVVARALHNLSSRAHCPYVAFNCASVPRDLFEAQLFGYRKGAFTGAHADHPGVIRAADGGTLLLDEVGELPLDVQPKLLRFLEEGEVFPFGEVRALRVDVRVVAATHRDLAALVRDGRFREDLYYRLHVVPLRVPPLRERREDIVPLARHFLAMHVPDGDPPVLAPGAVARLIAHDWPGNVRELRNVIERTLAFTPLPALLTAEMILL